jgi:hypothetical protein
VALFDKEMDMRMKILVVAALTLAAFGTLGFSCINEGFIISVNIEGITGTFEINQGNGNFSNCVTVDSKTYLDVGYDNLKNIRIYDVRVSTIGSYTGNVTGTASVNGVNILQFSGPFAYFNTPRSILNDPNITRFNAGILALTQAIQAKSPVRLCGVGSATPSPFPAGQSVKVEVLGQVDAEP